MLGLDDAQGGGECRIGIDQSRVQQGRIRCGTQRRVAASGVARVALADAGQNGGGIGQLAPRLHFENPAGGPRLRGGEDEDFLKRQALNFFGRS